jgi:ATP-binding cassette, subfamily C (CFTR/MRP), member 1
MRGAEPLQAVLNGYSTATNNQLSFQSLEFGYLGSTKNLHQPLCGNIEGWGPLSPFRYDFTPCFLDVWISVVAVYGVVLGAGTIWWLVKRNTVQPVSKNWHFYAKIVSLR